MRFAIRLGVSLLCASVAARSAELEPAVRTSSAAAPVGAAQAAVPPAAPAAAAAATPATANRTATATRAPAAPRGAAGGARVLDRVELENTQITGNRELPKVMYVVPWKKPDLGEFAGRPPKSLLDELLAPVDRDVFKRQNRYFAALQPDAAAAPPAAGSGGSAESTAAPAPAGGDEK